MEDPDIRSVMTWMERGCQDRGSLTQGVPSVTLTPEGVYGQFWILQKYFLVDFTIKWLRQCQLSGCPRAIYCCMPSLNQSRDQGRTRA